MGMFPELDTDNYIGSFDFRVTIPDVAGDINQAFVRVSGVVSTSEPLGHAWYDPYVRKGVGRTSYEDVTLERIYNGSDSFYDWRMEVESGIITRRDVRLKCSSLTARSVTDVPWSMAQPWELRNGRFGQRGCD